LKKEFLKNALKNIQPIFSLEGDFSTKIKLLKSLLSDSEVGQKGIQELEFIEKALQSMPLKTAQLDLDVTLARGLNYYTGAIFEIRRDQDQDHHQDQHPRVFADTRGRRDEALRHAENGQSLRQRQRERDDRQDHPVHLGRADEHRGEIGEPQRADDEADGDGDHDGDGPRLGRCHAARKDAVEYDAGHEEGIPAGFQRLPQVGDPFAHGHEPAALIGVAAVDQRVGDQDREKHQQARNDRGLKQDRDIHTQHEADDDIGDRWRDQNAGARPRRDQRAGIGRGYPLSTRRSMVMRPTAAAPAASEPEIAANMPQTSTVAEPKPPFAQQVIASATSRNFLDSPVRTRTSPVRMKSGTAVSAK